MKNNSLKRYLIVYITFALLVVFDLVTKIVTDGIDVNVISGVLSFYSAHNEGAAWSILSDYTIILALISIVFVAGAITFDAKTKLNKNALYNVAYILILAGAFGNAIDRVFLHYVRDFIKLDFINFPIFNVADCLLVIGVIILAFYIMTYKENPKKQKVESDEDLKVEYINKPDESDEAKQMASSKFNAMKNIDDEKNDNKNDNNKNNNKS
ncbi:MAG: signal peptidase II [Christensenellales bacterium]